MAKVITMSKSFGPPTGPDNALERESAPVPMTVILSAPILSANEIHSPSGTLLVLLRSIRMLESVLENAWPRRMARRCGCWVWMHHVRVRAFISASDLFAAMNGGDTSHSRETAI